MKKAIINKSTIGILLVFLSVLLLFVRDAITSAGQKELINLTAFITFGVGFTLTAVGMLSGWKGFFKGRR